MSADINEDKLVAEIAELRALLRTKEAKLADLRREKQIAQEYGLNNDEICRYSRQLFLPEISVQGAVHMCNIFLVEQHKSIYYMVQFSC